ncbi:hypothetical protein BH10ACT1_BH10ACT1_20110 [soil metagenome]
MFAVHCSAEGRVVLLSTRRITAIRSFADRVEIDHTCWCGAAGTTIEHRHTGRPPVTSAAA